MKKLSFKQKLLGKRRARNAMRLRTKASAARRSSRKAGSRVSSPKHPVEVMHVPVHVRYYAPKEQRKEFGRFLERVEHYLVQGRSVYLDFSNTKRLFPCGVLIIMGVVDDWVQRFPNRLTANYPADDLVKQMLHHLEVL